MEGKVCSKCGVWKPLEEYHKDKKGRYGRVSQCKECIKNKRKKPTIINEQGLEVRIKWGATTYWKDDVMVSRKCSKCGKDKKINEFDFSNSRGNYQSVCKECRREKVMEYTKNNPDKVREMRKKYFEDNADKLREKNREYRKNNLDKERARSKKYYRNNLDKTRVRSKKWHENNPDKVREKHKKWCKNNPDKMKGYSKRYYQNNKENNLQYISSIVEQINPIFEKLNLPVYGYVYMFENVKTGHKYVGQSINPLKIRYNGSNIVRGWIKERLEKDTQKFKEELIEDDFIVTETLDIAFCQYHLDKLETYYIDKYDSFLNGYNNNAGHHDTDDGIEEFNQILLENNLEFIDGKLVKIA